MNNLAPIVTGNSISLRSSVATLAAKLFSASDPGSDSMERLEFANLSSGGGYLARVTSMAGHDTSFHFAVSLL